MDAPDCPACRGTAFEPLHRMPNGTTLRRCTECGLVARDILLALPERRQRYGDSSYFSKVSTPQAGLYGYNDYLGDRFLHMWLFGRRLDEIEELQPPGRLLDVGCGPGVMLDVARQRGWKVQGVDLSSYAINIARSEYNLDVFEGELQEAAFPDEAFDVVTMDDFIEHVTAPREVLVETARLLRPGGILAMSTPNASGFLARVMRKQWFHYKQEEHYYFFTPPSLRRLLDEIGFDVLSVRRSPRAVDLRFLFRRLGYYSGRMSRALLALGRRIPNLAFFVYTGEMRVLARKRI